ILVVCVRWCSGNVALTRRQLYTEHHAAHVLAFPVQRIGVAMLAKESAAHVRDGVVELVDISIRQLGYAVIITGKNLASLGVQAEECITGGEGWAIAIDIRLGFVLVNDAHILVKQLLAATDTDTGAVAFNKPGVIEQPGAKWWCSKKSWRITNDGARRQRRIITRLVETDHELAVDGRSCHGRNRQARYQAHSK